MRQITLLSGAKGVGKSTVCARVAALAREAGLRAAGVLSPPEVTPAEEKVGIWVEAVASGERRRLAVAAHLRRGAPIETTHWSFNVDALRWGAEVIAQATPCDLLLIDELGPLELERGEGWTVALDVLRGGAYRWALAVVRVGLHEALRARVPGVATEALEVTDSNRDALPAEIAARLWGARGAANLDIVHRL
jgi:nucleoside-triphosphatase THEP1